MPRRRRQTQPGIKLLRTLRVQGEHVDGIAWSPDGQMLATTSSDGQLRVWDAKTGELIRDLETSEGLISVTWAAEITTLTGYNKDPSSGWFGRDDEYSTYLNCVLRENIKANAEKLSEKADEQW